MTQDKEKCAAMPRTSAHLNTALPGALHPVRAHERIAEIDMLRGVALFGILLVNLLGFCDPGYPPFGRQFWPGRMDYVAEQFVAFVAQGKFYTLFSFLFGVGLAGQMARAEAQGVRFIPLALRRFGVLLLIGLAHALCVWDGDILRTYALLGGVSLVCRRRTPQTLMVWATICFILLLGLCAGAAGISRARWTRPSARLALSQEVVRDAAEAQQLAEEEKQLYTRGTYLEMVRYRARDLLWDVLDLLDLHIFAMILLGVYAGRKGIFHNIAAHLAFIRTVRWWGLACGLAGNALFVATGGSSDPSLTSVTQNLGAAGYIIGAPALCFFYAASLLLLVQHPVWRRRLRALAAVGRTALSNYLLQSLICTTLFYHYGLGLFGSVRPVLSLLLTPGIFLLQIPLSVWWLQHFQFGPLEWAWRSLTYGQRQPMRRVG